MPTKKPAKKKPVAKKAKPMDLCRILGWGRVEGSLLPERVVFHFDHTDRLAVVEGFRSIVGTDLTVSEDVGPEGPEGLLAAGWIPAHLADKALASIREEWGDPSLPWKRLIVVRVLDR